MSRIKKYEIFDIMNKFNEFYKTSNIFNFEQYGKNYRFIKFHGICQQEVIQRYLSEFFEKVKNEENTHIKLNMMYENKKVNNVEYDFGKFTQIWIYNPPKNIYETYVDLYKIADRGRFCIYYHIDENGFLVKEKSCVVFELLGSHVQTIKKFIFSGIEKTINHDIYESKIKDINHYAYYIKYFDNNLMLKKGLNITYGQNTDYHNYKAVNEFELLDVNISNDKRYLIPRDWY